MLKRIISGICLVAIAVPSLYFGGWLLYAVCLMVALIGNFEFAKGQIYAHDKRYDKSKGKRDQGRQYKNGKISF